jgi:TRAP-type C4-dicarboxylate transport system permease small subunit
MKLIGKLEAALSVVDMFVRWFAGSALLLMTAVLFFNSIGRTFLNVSFVGGPALGRLLLIWLCFIGSYLLVRSTGHVAIDLLSRAVSDRVYRWLSFVIGLVGGVTMAYVSWLGYLFTAKRFAYGQMDPMLELPTGLFYLPIPIGGFLMAVAFLFEAYKALYGVAERPTMSEFDVVEESE